MPAASRRPSGDNATLAMISPAGSIEGSEMQGASACSRPKASLSDCHRLLSKLPFVANSMELIWPLFFLKASEEGAAARQRPKIWIVPSELPDPSIFPSGENATALKKNIYTEKNRECPLSVRISWPGFVTSQYMTVLSALPVARTFPSRENATDVTDPDMALQRQDFTPSRRPPTDPPNGPGRPMQSSVPVGRVGDRVDRIRVPFQRPHFTLALATSQSLTASSSLLEARRRPVGREGDRLDIESE